MVSITAQGSIKKTKSNFYAKADYCANALDTVAEPISSFVKSFPLEDEYIPCL